MRRRRAQRCLLRAEVAIEAGCFDDARAALDEARALHAPAEELGRIEASLAAGVVAAEQPPRRMRWKRLAVAAVVVIGVSAFGLGEWQRQAPAPLPAAQAAGSDSAPPAEKAETPAVQNVPVRFSEVLAVPTAGIAPDPTESPDRDTEERAPELDTASNAPTTDAAPVSASVPPRMPEPPPVLVAATSSLPLAATAPPVAPPPPPPAPAEARPREMGPVARVAPNMTAVPGLAAAPPPRDESAEVRAILERYESAYTQLDPSLARAVWPGVNESALARAFGSLASQEISLGRCDVSVSGATARATCTGTAKWTPKVGGGGARTEARRWTFDLRRAGEGWQIERALAR